MRHAKDNHHNKLSIFFRIHCWHCAQQYIYGQSRGYYHYRCHLTGDLILMIPQYNKNFHGFLGCEFYIDLQHPETVAERNAILNKWNAEQITNGPISETTSACWEWAQYYLTEIKEVSETYFEC